MRPQPAAPGYAALDASMLEAYLRRSLPDLRGRMRIEQAGCGRADYRIRFDDRVLLLRVEPARGNLLPMASEAGRECRILHALDAAEVPVPKTVLHCEDVHVLGAPFWLMEHAEGRIFSNCALPELPAAERRAVFFAMAEAMAKLHRVDWAAAGLADCGRPTRFYAREVAHWTRLWEMSKGDGNRHMDRLAAWLSSHIPDDDEAAIIHGDFRLGNLVFHPVEARVLAVLGWERSTLGHPLADVAHNCQPWHLAAGEFGGLRGLDLADEGIPTQAEYLTHYRQSGGYAESVNTFHLAFSLFRGAMEDFGSGKAGRAISFARRGIELVDGCGC